MDPAEQESPNNNWIFSVIAGVITFIVLSHVLEAKNCPLLLSIILILGTIWLSLHITRKVADYLDSRQERRY